eukprot:412469_1
MYTIIVSMSIFYIILIVIGVNYSFTLYNATCAIYGMSSYIFMVYCLYKMPKLYDLFLIHQEINRLATAHFIINLYFIITVTTGLDKTYTFFGIFHGFAVMMECALFAAVPSVWPHFNVPSLNASAPRKVAVNNDSESVNDAERTKTWKSFVNEGNDDTNFNQFIRFLILEFAV